MSDPFAHRRPKHPDFDLLSQIIRDVDAQAVTKGGGGNAIIAIMSPHVDINTISYVATQRALRALDISTRKEMTEMMPVICRLAAVYLDAFMAGVKFAKAKTEPPPANRLMRALDAIEARVQGNWSHPALVEYGPAGILAEDIAEIIRRARLQRETVQS
ncbi:MAG: hypothetical protein ACM31O_14025 [Bacteroidota bacterium]